MLHLWLLIVQFCLHGDRSSCSILGLGLAVQGGLPACLPAGPPSRPPAQPWELPALRPPAAHRPCQAGRKKACLLTPSTWLLGAPWLCPEDVRPRAPGGGPGARLSVAEGNQAGQRLLLPPPPPPRSASAPSLQARLQALVQGPQRSPLRSLLLPSWHALQYSSQCVLVPVYSTWSFYPWQFPLDPVVELSNPTPSQA